MTKYMLDTNIASYAIKDRSRRVGARIHEIAGDSICLSVISEMELWYGLAVLPESHILHERVPAFLRRFEVLPWPREASLIFAREKRRLERTGQALHDFDIMIAAHALVIDAVLVTNNMRHFERISGGLRLENWHRE